MTYDEWKTRDPADDDYRGEDPEPGCTCRGMGAGGVLKTDKWCPLHGLDPDEEYERQRDDRWQP